MGARFHKARFSVLGELDCLYNTTKEITVHIHIEGHLYSLKRELRRSLS